MVISFVRLKRLTSVVMSIALLQTTLMPLGSPVAFAAEQRVSRMLGNQATLSTSKGKKNMKQAYVPGQVIVKFKAGGMKVVNGNNEAVRTFAKARKMTFKDAIAGQNIGVFSVEGSETVEQAVKRLKSDASVEYAEPNYIRSIESISTNDTYKDRLWALDNVGQTVNGVVSLSGADINGPQAWAISEGQNASPPIIVAVIDTGVYYNHSDLSGAMWDGSACVDDTGAALGGCIHGYDFADDDTNPAPVFSTFIPFWHGTAVAGVIAATKNNNNGVIGIAPNVKIMALRFALDTASEVRAIDFAIQNGAKIINASYGGSFFSLAEQEAIDRFRAAGGLFIAASGNASRNNDVSPSYPASYTLPNIISIASTDQQDTLSWFSNYGSTSVDVAAPGENIYATTVGSSTTTVLSENFESVTPPAVPNGWTVTGNFGTRVKTSGVSKVLYGDAHNIPYAANGDGTATVGPFDFSTTQAAHTTFTTRCDTEYQLAYTDYMKLEASGDGVNFTEIQRWDEIDLDNDASSAGFSPEQILTIDIPSEYLTAQTKLRFHWITNGSDAGTTGDGCFIDDVAIVKSTAGGEEYSFVDGTSFSAPFTAGLAGLIQGFNPTLTADQVKTIILTSGDSLPTLTSKTLSGKRINAEKALIAASPNAGSLYVTRSIIPIRSRQLLGGALNDEIQRLTFRAEGENVAVDKMVFTASGANAATSSSNIDRLELFVPGAVTPFAFATVGGCFSDIVPTYSFCARMDSQEFVVTDGTQKDVIVRPRMKTDINGAVSGQNIALTIDPTPSFSTGSIRAIGLTSSVRYGPNNANGVAQREIFIGTLTSSSPNVRINSSRHQVVLSKITSIVSFDPNPDGTAIPTGIASIGRFKFITAAASNFKNGQNKFTLSGIIFNVNATNVQLGSGDNTSLATSVFRVYNNDNPTMRATCTAAATLESPLGQTGPLVVTCLTAGSTVNTQIDPASEGVFILEADVSNPQISYSTSSLLQVSLTNFGSIDATSFSVAGSHISWMDADSGGVPVQFSWIEYPETSVYGTAYGTVPDTTPPVITLLGASVINVTVGSVYIDEGAIATDNVDTDLTPSIVVTNPVDTNVVGEYTVRYNVSDTAGNAATEVTRIVNVVPVDSDTTPPVIRLLGNSPVTVIVGTSYTDDGATALDDTDGDITHNIVVTNPVDTNVINTYTVRYNVSDAAGNPAVEVTREVNVVAALPVEDTVAPVITILGDLTVTLTVGDTYTDAGATATDNIDGDITQNIIVTNPVNTSVAGTYFVRYNVTDAAGNSALEVARTVNVNAPDGGTGGSSGGDSGGSGSVPSLESDNVSRSPQPQKSSGGHSGHNTNVLLAMTKFIAQQNGFSGDIPPASFGGADVPLTEKEKQYICSIQRALPDSVHSDAVKMIASHMSDYIARDPAYIVTLLSSSTLCADINVSLRPEKAPVKVAAVTNFPIGKDGMPISTNPFWNMCVRNLPMTFADLALNPDIDSRGRHYSCDHYHRSQNGWRHPDLDVLFSWNPTTRILRLPAGYEAKESTQDLGFKSTSLISALPTKEDELPS